MNNYPYRDDNERYQGPGFGQNNTYGQSSESNNAYYGAQQRTDLTNRGEYRAAYNYQNGPGYQQPQQTQGTQNQQSGKPPKQKKHIGAVLGGVLGGVAAGALVMGLLVMPNMSKTAKPAESALAEPTAAIEERQTEEASQEADAQAAEPAPSAEFGGAPVEITNANNPVPDIAEAVGRSVVGITVGETAYISGREPIRQDIASGTGFVISQDGLIMTNHHVVEGGNTYMVTTGDGEEYQAELVGSDPNTEVAVLRVEGLSLPAVPIGNSDEARTGELVIAIGNPIRSNLNGTVTVGYLSGTNRAVEITDNGQELEMLQMDAAINPGNSGGPLLNANGEVIGINTMKTVYAGTDGLGNAISAEGIGFAVPINTAMNVAEQIISTGSIELEPKPGIGFSYQLVSAEDAEMWGVPQGAMIAGVVDGSPADRVGLQVNDVIVMLDGVDLTTGADAPTFDGKSVGDTVSASVWRQGRVYDVEFVLADLNKLG